MKKTHTVLTIALTAVIVFMLSGLFYSKTFFGRMIYSGMMKNIDESYAKLMRIEALIDEKYMGEVDKNKMIEKAYGAYVEALGDPYTGYLDKKKFAKMKENLSGDYVGIGVEIRAEGDKILVIGVNPGSPAENAGIAIGDYIIAVNSVNYNASQMNEAIDAIKCMDSDEPIMITVERDGGIVDIEVFIEHIEVDYITAKMLDGNIGYLRIKTFGNDIAGDFETELRQLTQSGATGLIIDLRSNPGGILEQVVKITDMLVPEGTIITVREKNGSAREYKSDKNEISIPVCLLIDSGSASASEVMAGALRDFGKATLIGENTFGKGVVQGIHEFGDGTAIRITTAKYYTPSGECIHGSGIKPDIEISLPEESYISNFTDDIQNDTQLSKAVEILSEK